MRIYGTNVNFNRFEVIDLEFEEMGIEHGCQPAALELYSSEDPSCSNGNAHSAPGRSREPIMLRITIY